MSRITLTAAARDALGEDEVIFVDWHVTGLCCADAGEFSVRALRRSRLPAGPGGSGTTWSSPTPSPGCTWSTSR